nr:hypothetical protein [Flavobacteriaceae bacterium]
MKTKNYKLGSVFLVLITLFLLVSCSEEQKENDWTKGNLKGKVKRYIERSYKVKRDKESAVEDNLEKTELLEYNKNGYCAIEIYQLKRFNEYKTEYSYKYNKKGQVVERNKRYKNRNEKEIYKYDKEGKLSEVLTPSYRYKYRYDEA